MSAVEGDTGLSTTPGSPRTMGSDNFFVDALGEVAARMSALSLTALGSLTDVRERHLTDELKFALGQRTGKIASSSVVPVMEWPSLGRSAVDVVIPEDDNPRVPRHVLELKWCQWRHDKVYEAIWDLFKIALLTRLGTVETGHLVTGAPVEMWDAAFCRDIFEDGRFEPEQLCSRILPWSRSQRFAWDDLLWGGYDRFPDLVPATIRTTALPPVQVTDGALTWEIRSVSVEAEASDVPFVDGWPHGRRPSNARHPLVIEPADLVAVTSDAPTSVTPTPLPVLGERFDEALTLARTLHAEQVRRDTAIPYLAHLLAVAALVLEDGGDEEEAIAAVLHDAVEDQGGSSTLEDIRRRFGDQVADIVDACSDTDEVPKPPWPERKQAYIDHLPSLERSALRVSLADKLHNARAILFDLRHLGEAVWERFSTGSADDQLWYYDELARVYEARSAGPMAAELRRTVDEIAAVNRAESATRS